MAVTTHFRPILSHPGLNTDVQHIGYPANSVGLELIHAPEGDNGGDGHSVPLSVSLAVCSATSANTGF
jgi:hypothetical protein